MKGKTIIQMFNDDQRHGDWKKGEEGYIDGYCRGGDGAPYAVVVIKDRIVMAPIHSVKVIKPKE